MSKRIRTSFSLGVGFPEALMDGSLFGVLQRRLLLLLRFKEWDGMVTSTVYNIGNEKVSDIELDERVFDRINLFMKSFEEIWPPREDCGHQE
jgi:hypothetical protein